MRTEHADDYGSHDQDFLSANAVSQNSTHQGTEKHTQKDDAAKDTHLKVCDLPLVLEWFVQKREDKDFHSVLQPEKRSTNISVIISLTEKPAMARTTKIVTWY